MRYTDKLIKVQDEFAIYIPDPEKIKPVYENLLSKNAATPFPFWAKIWPSAKAMSAFLQREPVWIEGKSVIEIGAGIGLPSLIMAARASAMIISDHSADAVKQIEKNIQYLGLKHVQAVCIDWNHFPAEIKAETVLLSDINYAPDQFESLLALIRTFLTQGATIILSTPQRITITPFAEALQPFMKRSVLQVAEDGGATVEIRILVLSI